MQYFIYRFLPFYFRRAKGLTLLERMKFHVRLIKILAPIILLVTISSCKKFVDIDPPPTQLVTATVFNNNEAATSAMTGIYSQMYLNTESYHLSQNTGLLSDELIAHSNLPSQRQFYTNSMVASSIQGPWKNAYSYIYQANAILEAVTNNSALNEAVAKQLKGEALFVRAFWHFYLTNCYGDVPLVTSSNYVTNSSLSRTSKSSVYEQVVVDLQAAQGLLSDQFVDASDTTVTLDRVRPTKWAASALMARTYLYIGNWAGAESAATAVIENSSMFQLVPLSGVFLSNSMEAIWQIATPLPTTVNTLDGQYYVLTAAPSTSGANSSTLSPFLLDSFETNDGRYAAWVDSITIRGNTYYFPSKYKGNKLNFSGDVTEYTMVLRLAELYLIRAEARAHLNNVSEGLDDLNTIRSRANLSMFPATSDPEVLLAAILKERKIELFSEWGHRWFDLIRTNNITEVMSLVTPVKSNGSVTWNAFDSLYPIPQSELLIDPNLVQNEGY